MVDVPRILKDYMVEELNKELNDTCLKYVKEENRGECITRYRLKVIDKYIKQEYQNIPDTTDDFEKFVRNFFKEKYEVKDLGYSNSIITLSAWK